MFDVFMFSFNAVMPILLLVLLGYILRKINFAPDSFFKTANKMVFRIFLPILLFYNVYEIKTLSDINWSAVIFSVIIVLVLFVIGIVSGTIFAKNRDQIGVISQNAFRSNYAIIGISLAASLGGSDATAFASVITAVLIPLFNFLGVIVLSYYSDNNKKPGVKETLLRTLKNPLILGVSFGLVILLIRSFIPVQSDGTLAFSLQRDCPFIMNAVESASKVASPFALVVLGARFDFSAIKVMLKQISAGVILKLIVAPILGLGSAILLTKYTGLINITANEYPALIAAFGSPVAVSSAVMVSEIGGDDQLATQLVVWTSVLSMLSLFITVFLLRSIGLL